MSRRVKLAKPITVDGDKVEIVHMEGDRIPADSYQGWIDDSTAIVLGRSSFRVPLGTNFRRLVTCQVIVAPGTATVIPRPTLHQAFGLLCQSIEVRPLNGSDNWRCVVTIELDCGETIKYCHTSGSYYQALHEATERALKNAADWYDPDPLSPKQGDILEVPVATIHEPSGPIQ